MVSHSLLTISSTGLQKEIIQCCDETLIGSDKYLMKMLVLCLHRLHRSTAGIPQSSAAKFLVERYKLFIKDIRIISGLTLTCM